MNQILRTALFILLALNTLRAATGPTHKSLRALGMGNAFVALVDDKEALYYNPAGLNLINRLGNYELDPERGYYPHNSLDMRINFGGQGPVRDFWDAYRLGRRITRLIDTKESETEGGGNPILDSLSEHPELIDDINKYDRLPISIGTKFDMELALHNFGGAIWADAGVAPYMDMGVIMPFVGVDTFYVDLVAQMAFAFSPVENWSVGVGYKVAKREFMNTFEVSVMDWEDAQDTLEEKTDDARSNLSDLGVLGHAVELGVLYQLNRDVRTGASLRNLFLTDLNGQSITPNLTVGIAASPRRLQRNTAYSRKVNFAMDFADMLNNERNYKFMSHLNFGMELEQVLLAVPSVNNTNLRALKTRFGVGFKGGYPTGTVAVEVLRIAELEATTWADEGGYYTGQKENRYYMAQLSIGL